MMNEKTKSIPFTKMQGAGNDFVVLDNRQLQLSEEQVAELAPAICDRKFGVGSDGILALTPTEQQDPAYTMIYRNPDGSNAGMCGNGARCIALFAHNLGFNATHKFNVHDEIYEAEVTGSKNVRISFPMETSVNKLDINGQAIYQIHTGTEHIVLPIDKSQLQQEDQLASQGRALRHHELFQPKGTNVNFISGTAPATLQLQTYERGVEDLTLACGTGAIASAVVWHHLQMPDKASQKFSVETKGGTLNVHFSFNSENNTYSNIKLEGPAHFVFKGEFLH